MAHNKMPPSRAKTVKQCLICSQSRHKVDKCTCDKCPRKKVK